MEIVHEDLEKLVEDQIPNWRNFPRDRKFRIRCPHCEEGKSPALSVLRDLSAGICFRCELLFLRDDTKGELKLDENFLEKLEQLKPPKSKDSLIMINTTILSLYNETQGNDFLRKRDPYVSDWRYYGIREGDHEVITPYYLFGEMVYYQIRHYDPRGFRNPREVNAPIYIPSDVEHTPGYWYQDAPTVICEGPFDAIALSEARKRMSRKFNIAGLGGKVITRYRAELLHQLGVNRISIFLDEEELSKDLKGQMGPEFGWRNINIIPSSGPDPEEVLRILGMKKFIEFIEPYIFDESTFKDKKYSYSNYNKELKLDDTFSIEFK